MPDLSNTEEIFGKEIYNLTKSVTGKESAELNALVLQSIKVQEIYDGVFPKVDPRLVRDLCERMTQSPSIKPLYIVEVFTTNTVESQWCKDHIFATTGFIPAIYDNGTHYVTNMRLTLDILKRLNDFDFVVEVTGDYTGTITAIGASHEVGAHRNVDLMEKEEKEALQQRQKQKGHSETTTIKEYNYKSMIYPFMIIVGALAFAGLIISGGMLPNINNNTAVHTRSASDIGKLGGQVSGPTGLPAIGASVIAYKKMGLPTSIEKSKGYTANSIILLDGHYTFDLPSGVYRVIVAYPDGKSQIMDNYAIWSGSISSLNFKHG